MSEKYNPKSNLKCYRGKRIVEMCISTTTPVLDNTASSTIASNIVSSASTCTNQASENSLIINLDLNKPGTLSTTSHSTIDPDSGIIILATNSYNDIDMCEYDDNNTPLNINDLPVLIESFIETNNVTTANPECSSISNIESSFATVNSEILDSDPALIRNISLNDVSYQHSLNLNESDIYDVQSPNILQDITLNTNLPIVPYSNSSDSDTEFPLKSKTRKKKIKVDRKNWFAERNKTQRESGSKYYGRVKKDAKWVYEVEKEPRRLKKRCKCKGTKLIKCQKINENQREQIFIKFWKKLNWGEKKVYIDEHVKCLQVKRHRDRKNVEESRRTQSLVYYLPGKNEEPKVRVCKTMFLNTLNIGRMTILGWKKKMNDNCRPSEQRGATQNVPSYNERQENLSAFFDALPKMESHYCRASTTRNYLLPEWQSKKALYDFYVSNWAVTHNVEPLSTTTFFKIMEEINISLFRPKKDECEKCASYKSGNLGEEEYRLHIIKKEEARKEKEKDKNDASCIVVAADVQAVLLCPVSKISTLYYKTKLCVHNLCFKNLKNTDAFSYVWNESEGGVNAEEFASIWVSFLELKVAPLLTSEYNRIIIYTDGCGYQNRNAVMSNALLNFAVKHNVYIEQKYLQVGHTQMEVDSMHSAIERNLKNKVINVPADYINIIKNARKEPYNVEYLTHGFFKKFDCVQAYKSIRPGRSVGDAKVNDIRAIQYSAAGEIYYKLRFGDDWTEVPQRKSIVSNVFLSELPNLHENRLPIKARKYQDLQLIKIVLPVDYHEFYDNLPH